MIDAMFTYDGDLQLKSNTVDSSYTRILVDLGEFKQSGQTLSTQNKINYSGPLMASGQ